MTDKGEMRLYSGKGNFFVGAGGAAGAGGGGAGG